MNRIVAIAVLAFIHGVLGVELTEMSAIEGRDLLKSYYLKHSEFNTGSWGDDCAKLLPFKFKLGNGSNRYLLSEAEYHHADGMDWLSYVVTNGTLKQLGIEVDGFWFQPCQLFLVVRVGGRRDVIYYDRVKNNVVDCTSSERKCTSCIKWYSISDDSSGELAAKLLNKSIGDVLMENDVVSISRLKPYQYRGVGAEIVPNIIKDEVKEHADLSAERRISVAKSYLEDLRRRIPNTSCGYVLMVVGDVNGDGICDAYVSSEAERTSEGDYLWRLYSGGDGHFADKDEIVEIQSFEKAIVSARVKASCDDFYFVKRETGEGYAIVIMSHGNLVVPTGYLAEENVVRKLRRKYGHEGLEFYSCLPSVEWRGVGNLEDLFLDGQAPLQSLRRIGCERVEVK